VLTEPADGILPFATEYRSWTRRFDRVRFAERAATHLVRREAAIHRRGPSPRPQTAVNRIVLMLDLYGGSMGGPRHGW
jgi:hypothetical protein